MSTLESPSPVRIAVDIGGTFTDLQIFDARSGAVHSWKTSTTPRDPSIGLMRPNATDAALRHPNNIFNIASVYKPMGIMVEQGLKYQIKINAPRPKSASPWKGDVVVSTRGPDPSTLTLADRLSQIVYWPLKRQLFVQPFKVIARAGSTGSDETVLEPDDDKRSNNLETEIPSAWHQNRLAKQGPRIWFDRNFGLIIAHFAIRGLRPEAALKADDDPDQFSFIHTARVIRRKLARFPAIFPSTASSIS